VGAVIENAIRDLPHEVFAVLGSSEELFYLVIRCVRAFFCKALAKAFTPS
jgi:hypothetical protein